MRRSFIGLLRTLLVSAVLAGLNQALLVASQSSGQQQQDETITRVAILEAKGVPSEARPAPVTLTLAKGVQVGSLMLTIRFPTNLVTFQKVEVGGIAEALGAEAEAEFKTGEKDEGVLQLTIATPEKDGARTALPQGPLASLWFKIAKDAKPLTIIPLKIIASTAIGTSAGAGTAKLETRDGQITVSTPVVFACFFYMH